jgi:glutaredoxin
MGEKLTKALKKEKKNENENENENKELEKESNISTTSSKSESLTLRIKTDPSKLESKEEKKNFPKLCEKNQTYQKYLKYMVKNNYNKLSYEELCAFFIQICWRKFYIKNNNNNFNYNNNNNKIIEIIYSNKINENQNEKIFNFFDNKNFPLKIYNLKKYSKLNELIIKLGGNKILPIVFINGFYIGSYDELKQIEKIIKNILNNNFENLCLNCFIYKIDNNKEICPFCHKKKFFFALKEEKFNIWENRK